MEFPERQNKLLLSCSLAGFEAILSGRERPEPVRTAVRIQRGCGFVLTNGKDCLGCRQKVILEQWTCATDCLQVDQVGPPIN